MKTLSKIIKERESPGILIFDLGGRLIFTNDAAAEMRVALMVEEIGEMVACEELSNYCSYLTGFLELGIRQEGECGETLVLEGAGGATYSARPFLIGDDDQGEFQTHIMFLVEKIIKRHEVHLDKSRTAFRLTKREAEVAGLVCEGCSNREISKRLFISEFTVKNHLKSVIKKTGASSRNHVLALLQ